MRGFLLLLALVGCTEEQPWQDRLTVLVPASQDPFAGATSIALVADYADGTSITWDDIAHGGEVSLTGLRQGEGVRFTLTARAADGSAVGLGRSMPFDVGPDGVDAALWVAEPDTLVRVPIGLQSARTWTRAAVAANGRVVAVGGGDNASTTIEPVEFLGWDPETPLEGLGGASLPRIGHTVVAVPEGAGAWGGQVVVLGGTFGDGRHTLLDGIANAVGTASLIDPVSGELERDAVTLNGTYMDSRPVWTTDGRIALLGGYRTEGNGIPYLDWIPLLDPADGSESRGPDLGNGTREQHATGILQTQGRRFVLVSGGLQPENVGASARADGFLWDFEPATEVEQLTGDGALRTARARHTTTDLGTGQVLAIGGATAVDDYDAPGTVVETAELFDVGQRAWTEVLGRLAVARQRHVAVRVGEGRVLVCAGEDASGAPVGTCEVFTLADRLFAPFTGGSMNPGGPGVEAVPLGDGRVVFLGGASGLGPDDGVYLYTPLDWQQPPL